MLRTGIGALALFVSACGEQPASDPVNTPNIELDAGATPTPSARPSPNALPAKAIVDLPGFFDCAREEKALIIAAHRGGPAPGYPENALETMQNALEAGIRVFEIDVATSQDGVLYLMHDRSLRRTTGYSGSVADTNWSTVSGLTLKDKSGQNTRFNPPKLTDALIWAKESGAILELDRKETSSFRDIVSAVRAAGAENNVILISYNDNQAGQIAKVAPDLMLTAGVRSRDHQNELEDAGIRAENLIAWMGTERPNTRAFQAVGRRGVETAFGTLGRPGERLDDQYIADGDAREYQDLVDGGLTLLATDEPFFVADNLTSDDKVWERCS